jgi:hypothetical protein
MIDDFIRMMKEMVMSYFKATFQLSSTDTHTNPEKSKIRKTCNMAKIRTSHQPNTILFTKVHRKE